MAAEQLPVERHPVRVVAVVGRQKAVPGAFLGLDHVAQGIVAEPLVCDENNTADLGQWAFVDLEYEVDAVLRQLDHLGIDCRREPSGAPVKVDDTLHVVLYAGPGENDAWPQLDFALQNFALEALVAFECDAVDDRVFHDTDDDRRPFLAQHDIGKQSGGEQLLQGFIQCRGADRVADSDGHIRADGVGFDALRAFDAYCRCFDLRTGDLGMTHPAR